MVAVGCGWAFVGGFEMSEWTRVEFALPDQMKEVIVYDEYSGVGTAQRHFDGEWILPVSDWKYGRVTHWMPLPEPPKK